MEIDLPKIVEAVRRSDRGWIILTRENIAETTEARWAVGYIDKYGNEYWAAGDLTWLEAAEEFRLRAGPLV